MFATRAFVVVALLAGECASVLAAESSAVAANRSLTASNVSTLARPPCRSCESFESPLPTWRLGRQSTMHVRGRVDTDFITTSQSAANVATFGNLGGVVGLRRARIGAEGSLPFGRYLAEIDLPAGQLIVRDVFVGLGDLQKSGESRVGHFREPFSLEGGTSANSFAFMERSPINVLDPARNWGVGFFRAEASDAISLAAGAFYAGADTNDFQGGDGATVGLTERFIFAPIHDQDTGRLWHFGIALSERIPESGVITINQQPRSPLLYLGDSSNSPFVPVIEIPASYQQLLNLQLAIANGPLWAQSEWYGSWIVQSAGHPVFFHGSYVACGCFITGEHRTYPGPNGGLGAVHVDRPFLRGPVARGKEHGWGAWELVARFSYLDFLDADTPLGPSSQAVGIQLPESTFGVNWYLADHVRLMFNYVYAVPDEPNTGASAANEYAMRLGIFW